MVMWGALRFSSHNDNQDAEKERYNGSGAMESDHAVEAIPAAVESL
jgi:hypothetical protein